MKPLRLEWTLSSQLSALSYPLHVDALVAYAVTELGLRHGDHGANVRDLANELPLQKMVRDGDWCWMASALSPNRVYGQELRLWTRRTDAYDFAQRVVDQQVEFQIKFPMKRFAGQVHLGAGLLKQHFQFFPVKNVDKMVAWCVGDEDRLMELLHPDSGLVTSIGPRGRAGFGAVRDFTISADNSAYELWRRRVLPWNDDRLVPIHAANKPPYWASENRVNSFVHPEIFV